MSQIHPEERVAVRSAKNSDPEAAMPHGPASSGASGSSGGLVGWAKANTASAITLVVIAAICLAVIIIVPASVVGTRDENQRFSMSRSGGPRAGGLGSLLESLGADGWEGGDYSGTNNNYGGNSNYGGGSGWSSGGSSTGGSSSSSGGSTGGSTTTTGGSTSSGGSTSFDFGLGDSCRSSSDCPSNESCVSGACQCGSVPMSCAATGGLTVCAPLMGQLVCQFRCAGVVCPIGQGCTDPTQTCSSLAGRR